AARAPNSPRPGEPKRPTSNSSTREFAVGGSRAEVPEPTSSGRADRLLPNRTADLPLYHYGASFRKEEGMSNQLPVDPLALREEVQAKCRAVAIDPHGSYHFHTGRPLARRLGYDEATTAALAGQRRCGFCRCRQPILARRLESGRAGSRSWLRRRVRLLYSG